MTELSTVPSPFTSITTSSKHQAEVDAAHIFEENFMIICFPLGILGIIGNGIICYLFFYTIEYSRFIVYFQTINLANMTVLFNHFIYFFRYFFDWNINAFALNIIEMLEVLGYNTRFYILTAICVERYVMIFYPVCDKRYRPQYFSVMVTGALGALSCAITLTSDLTCLTHFYSSVNEFMVICSTTSVLRLIIEILILLISMVLSTVAILISMKRQRTSPARLDITIVATVLLFLLTDTPMRVTDIILFWVENVNTFAFIVAVHMLDTINCMVIPFIFLAVGCWKRASEPISKFLERAVQFEETTEERTEADEEQA